MNVLAVGAHPDDLEILCAGTLALCATRGDQLTMAHVANGDAGSFGHQPEQIAAIRDGEAQHAAELIGARHVNLGVSDGCVNAADPDQRRAVTDLIRASRPELVITHPSSDYMPDHNEVSKLVLDATFVATLPNYRTDHPAHDTVAAVHYMDTLAGVEFQPTDYVDITTTLGVKLAMFETHQSQVQWLREHDGVDMIEQIRTVARFRGLQCGVDYAEGFTSCKTWLRTRPLRLLP